MRALVKNHNKEVEAHLLAEFGRYDECCGVVAPPWLASFIIEEALQTDELGLGPKEIPPGEYFVDCRLGGGITSHTIVLYNYTTGEKILFEVGYVALPYVALPGDLSGSTENGHCIDWRGAKKIPPKQ